MIKSRKTLLFVGGGIETLPGIKLAQSMNLFVVVSDINPEAPCMQYANACLIADTYNEYETLNVARKFHDTQRNIDGVICMASDIPLTVAIVANELKLPGIPIVSAKIVSDKILMKDCFKNSNLPIPKYKEVSNITELENIIEHFGFPFIIKPVDSRGARGVLKVDKCTDLDWAYSTSKYFSPTDRVMIEEYMPGPQISTESLVINGEVFTVGFSDRNYEFLEKYAPNMIENGGDLPSYLSTSDQLLIKNTVERTAKALNIKNGVIKGDMVLSNGKPYIIEVAARLSGGYFCSHEIPLSTGVDFVGNAIKIALGDEVNKNELEFKLNKAISQRYFFPEPGKVVKIKIPHWVKNDKRVIMCEIRVDVGDIVPIASHHPSRAGVVICTENSPEKAKKMAERVINEVIIETVN